MTEYETIKIIADTMPRSPLQVNGLFESDSEIIKHGSGFLLYSIDEFSREDMFVENDGYALGHNIAVGTLSDIYASGGIPTYYAHSLTINEMFTEMYLKEFSQGIADVLKLANVTFIGGDFGKAKEWRCVSSVIGYADKPIMRSGAKPKDNIYITGEIGDGNLQVSGIKTQFELRSDEAKIIRGSTTACIDTSDGVFNGINTISKQSNVGFELHDLPYVKAGLALTQTMSLPKEMLFFCECGEYELLFTSPLELPFRKIGTIVESGRTLEGRDISKFNISARDYANINDYVEGVKRLCDELL